MILVTGCTGYIGFHICEFLELKRLPYFGIDNFSRSHSKNIINKKKFLKTDIKSKIILNKPGNSLGPTTMSKTTATINNSL